MLLIVSGATRKICVVHGHLTPRMLKSHSVMFPLVVVLFVKLTQIESHWKESHWGYVCPRLACEHVVGHYLDYTDIGGHTHWGWHHCLWGDCLLCIWVKKASFAQAYMHQFTPLCTVNRDTMWASCLGLLSLCHPFKTEPVTLS